MREYEEYVAMAVERFKDVSGVSMVLLFGSVARGEAKRESDIDLAVIVDDSDRLFCTGGLSDFFSVTESCIGKIGRELESGGSPRLDVSIYYRDEYNRGIKLTGRREGYDMLNEVGVVMHDDSC